MNGSRAKQIRKEVYGDQSHKQRRYSLTQYERRRFLEGVFFEVTSTTLFNTGLRAEYLKRKKEYRLGRGQ